MRNRDANPPRASANETALRSRLHSLAPLFSGRRIAIVGDIIADQFVHGEISRVSREAPVLILRHEHTETVPGGAANCAMNVAALGATAQLVGVIGDDAAGHALRKKLEAAGVICRAVQTVSGAQTTTKVRILAGRAHAPRQQVIRLDYEDNMDEADRLRPTLDAEAHKAFAECDAAIISDYGYGVASERIAEQARRLAHERRIAVVVDSRHSLDRFFGLTSATPNEAEVEDLCGERIRDAQHLEEIGQQLCRRLHYRALLITRGANGMLLVEPDRAPLHIPAVGSRDAVDVTGAGDTVIAAYALALACGASFEEAAHVANYAGSVVVMKRGTATVSIEELLAALAHST
ncbi:MAG: sugar kinase [Pyrinomonas sp.]|uniref:bifunctional heptose 7-phosphate kinase/heptose 1-phosphate adenyltransferase n=1 Tax=Pyrinomonas sp. TaxID=2080306 RepID=UPI00331ACB2E